MNIYKTMNGKILWERNVLTYIKVVRLYMAQPPRNYAGFLGQYVLETWVIIEENFVLKSVFSFRFVGSS